MKNGFLAPIYFLAFLISVHCNKTLLYKIGENITLILPVKDNIAEVLWAKYGDIFLDLSFDNNGDFVNKASNPRNCLFNYTSITIYNATSDDEGMYAANVNSSNKITTEVYYVKRLDEENQVKPFTRIGWSKGNRTEIAAITYDNPSDIQLNMSGDFCGETTNVTGIVGQGLRLQIKGPTSVKRTESATIGYKDPAGTKLNMSHDGSLLIDNVTMEDQGSYTVNIKRWNTPECNHTYNVTTSNDKSWTNLIIIAVAVILVIAITLLIIYRTKSKRNRENRPKFEEVPRQDNPAPDLEQVPLEEIPAPDLEQVPLEEIPAPDLEQVPLEEIPAPDLEQVPLEEIPAPDLEQVPLEEIPAPVRTPPSNNSHQNEGGGNEGGGNEGGGNEGGGNEEGMNEEENEGGQNEEEL